MPLRICITVSINAIHILVRNRIAFGQSSVEQFISNSKPCPSGELVNFSMSTGMSVAQKFTLSALIAVIKLTIKLTVFHLDHLAG